MSDRTSQTVENSARQEEEAGVRLLLDQLRQLWNHRLLILAVATAVTALAALWTLRQPKIFEAAVTIEYDPNPARPLGSQVQEVTEENGSYWSTREYYNTQYRVITSERVAEGVVRQLGLQHDADFLQVPPERRRSFRSVSVEAAAGALRGRIRIDPIKESRLVNVHVEDTSPRRAQLLANTVAAVYIRQNLEQKLSTTVSSLEWLGQQTESLRNQLEASEMALHEYRLRNNLLSVSYEDRRSHVGNRIERLSNGVTEALERRLAISARVAELRRAASSSDPLSETAPELLSSGVLQALRSAYEGARRNRDTLATRYGEQSAQILAADAGIRELVDAIRHEIRNILGSSEAELRTARRIETDLRNSLDEAQHEALELNLREIQYGRLQRERENNAKLYGIVLERTKETDLTRLLRVNNMRVLDDAQQPGAPSKPRVLMNLLGGLVGGLLCGIAAAIIAIQADRSVRSQVDIEERLRATFLGVVPKVRANTGRSRYKYGYTYGEPANKSEGPVKVPELIVHTHPSSSIAEACRVIRTNLLFMSADQPFKTLMVSSASAREGKTTVAVFLATTLAQSGKRVLLIDTDLRRPRVHRVFGVRPPVGMTSALVNEASLEDAIIETEVPNLSILPCGPIPPNPAELLQSQRFQDVLKQASSMFDRVVFDTPPISAVSDALVIAPQVNGTVLVVRAHKTARARASAILQQIRTIGGRVAGVILNDVDLERDGGNSYYYGGSYEYGPQKEVA